MHKKETYTPFYRTYLKSSDKLCKKLTDKQWLMHGPKEDNNMPTKTSVIPIVLNS